jgi:small-conductance mechanosensitive channel
MFPIDRTLEITLAVVVAMVGAHWVGGALLRRSVRGPGHRVSQAVLRRSSRPLLAVLPLAGLEISLAGIGLPTAVASILLHVFGVTLILAAAWLVVSLSYVLDDLVLSRYRLDVDDNLHARQVHTQIQVLRRVTTVVVSVVAVSLVLLTFPTVRSAGAGLLASAGLVGLLAGVAARPAAANVVAGLQLAASQPIRVDDVVVVEGHWGRIEQIGLTFVVVRVWDLRRLVVPISYFIENPFENWTKSSSEILGWVHLEVDYTAPVDRLRARLREIAQKSPDWDGDVCNLQVTNLGPETMQLRALVSSQDSSRSWNLQCEVREKLVAFLQEQYPEALPHRRDHVAVSPARGQVPSHPARPGAVPVG